MSSIRSFLRIRNVVAVATLIALMATVLMVGINPVPASANCLGEVVLANTAPEGICLTGEAGAVPFSTGVVTGERLSAFFAATVTPISTPDAAYVASTTLIDISGLLCGGLNPSITDGTELETFSVPLQKLQVGPPCFGWATWDSPTDAETATPHVLFTGSVDTLDIALSVPALIVGFEVEPNFFLTYTVTADFYAGGCTGGTLEGSVVRTVNGLADSKLFAARADGALLDCVKIAITGNTPGGGFAIAQPRYALNSPPDCSAATASPNVLWPPNHKLVDISVLGVTDPNGDSFTIIIDSIFQDEAVDAKASGKVTVPDGAGVGTSTAQVRSERVGDPKTPGNGRVYHIGFTATDVHGGTCIGEVLVGVPHDQGKGATAVDGGPLFDSTVVP